MRAAGKMVAVLKVGRSVAGVRAARSHTGALVGSAAVYDAAFRRAGVLAVNDLRTLIDMAVALPGQLQARGPNVGIVSMSGGAGVMIADRCSAGGLIVTKLTEATEATLRGVLPAFSGIGNPVDHGAIYGNRDAIEAIVASVAADPNVDLVIMFIGLSPNLASDIEERLARVKAQVRKPLLVAWLGGPREGIARLRSLAIPAFDDPDRTVDAAIQLARAGAELTSLGAPQTGESTARATALRTALQGFLAGHHYTLTERDLQPLLTAYGIPVIEQVAVTSAAEALQAHGISADRSRSRRTRPISSTKAMPTPCD
jgi:acetyltransferase